MASEVCRAVQSAAERSSASFVLDEFLAITDFYTECSRVERPNLKYEFRTSERENIFLWRCARERFVREMSTSEVIELLGMNSFEMI